jgi:hypothetical protein
VKRRGGKEPTLKTRRALQTATAALFVLSLLPLGAAPRTEAQATSRTFPETGKTVRGPFLRYWETHGGLAQQGFPISDEMQERSPIDGKTYNVQYFERAVFELHPELAGTPHEVLLSLLGVWQYGALYGPSGAPNQRPNLAAGSVLFPQTGKRMGGPFLDYWQRNGGLAQQGYPISDEITEISAMDGKPYTVQYFERAAFERHPDMAGTPHEVMLSQLGRYRHNVVHAAPQLPAPDPNRMQVNLVASDLFLAWREVEAGDTNPDPEYRPTYILRAMDLRTGRSFPVATTYNEFSKPAISGSLLAWASENPQCPECDMDIYARDLATGETTLVATGPAIQFAPAISGRDVAWMEQNGFEYTIGVKELDTTKQTLLRVATLFARHSDSIALSSDFVAWVISQDAGVTSPMEWAISYNRNTGAQEIVAHDVGISGRELGIAGEYLVALMSYVHVTNLSTGKITELHLHRGFDLAAGKSEAFWMQEGVRNTFELWGLSLSASTFQPIHVDTGAIRDPAISGDRLLYIKDSKLTTKRISEVLGTR